MTLRRWVVLALLAANGVVSLAWWWQQGVPVAMVDASEKLQCVSYAPYRKRDQSPFQKGIVIPAAQIEADLAVLARHFDCVRTYSVDQGLDQVPRVAGKLGLKVMLGIWLGRDPVQNEREMQHALEVIRRDAASIASIIVGNEVLLRRELPASTLARHIQRVREATSLPVTYADVWEFWLQHRELAQAVSFVTVHILPYWEDDPVPIDRAIAHVVDIHRHVRAAFSGREIYIGETGWPSAGRNRHGARPGRIEQARFVRELEVAAKRDGLRFNLVEAFDQSWKRLLEGTVGGHWGMYDHELQPKFPFAGPIEADPQWRKGWIASLASAALFILIGLLSRRRWLGLLGLTLAGLASGAVVYAQLRYLIEASRGWLEWAISSLYTGFAAACAIAVAVALARWLDGERVPCVAPLIEVNEWLKSNRSRYTALERLLGALRFAFLFGATVVGLLLVFDPRYRNFPLALYALPFVGYWLLRLAGSKPLLGVEERTMGVMLPACVAGIHFHEGFRNLDALMWSLVLLAGAGLTLSRKHEQAAEEPRG
jgi:glucan 1,3-beta-glucosidase